MATRKARADERKGMERYERRVRKDRRDESKGMKEYWDHHNRYPRYHHHEDDVHLEMQKVHCDRRKGIDRVLQDAHSDSLAHGAQSGKMSAGKGDADWNRGDKRLTPRGA